MIDRVTSPLLTSITQEDPHVLGYFNLLLIQKKYNFVIEYTPNWSGRIAGIITGAPDEIKKAFAALEDNELIGVRDLIESIKFVRTKIFQEKQRHADGKEWSRTRGPR